MADQATEQLVIEAKLRDLFTPEARRVSASLKTLERDVMSLDQAASSGGAGGGLGKSLAGAIPQVKRVGGELMVLRGGATAAASAMGGIAAAAGEGEVAMLGMSAAGGPLALAITAAGIGAYELVSHLREAHAEAKAFGAEMQGVVLRSSTGSGGAIDDFTKRLEALSKTTKIAKEKLAEGGVEIMKSFSRSPGDAITVLEETARVAKVSGEDTTKAFSDIGRVLDSYKLFASDAADVSKQLFAAAIDGKSDLAEVANVMEKLGPSTRALGFDFQHTLAAVLAMSEGAGGMKEAGSALDSLFNRLLADKGLQTRLHDIDAGFDSTGKNANNLIAVLRDLQQLGGGDNAELAGLFGGSKGAHAAMAIASADADKLTDAYRTLALAGDSVDESLRQIGALGAKAALTGFAESMANARKQGLLAAIQGDEQGVKKWIDEYAMLSDAADESAKSQVASLQDVRAELNKFLEPKTRPQPTDVAPEVAAKAQALFDQIHSKTLNGLEKQIFDQHVIEQSLERQIALFEGQGLWMGKLTAQLHMLKDAHVQAIGLAEDHERLTIAQQLATQTQKNLELEQQRAVANGDLNEAARIGDQILAERARGEIASSEMVIAGLMEQRRAYPKIADAIDAVIGKIRERQFLEGQAARGAADKAAEAAQHEQLARAIAAEEQLQTLRNSGLVGLEREIALIEQSHDAAIRKAQDEAKTDKEKAARLGNLILLLDGEAARQKDAAQGASDIQYLRMEAELVSRIAESSGERLLALERVRVLERESMVDEARKLGRSEEEIRMLEDLFDKESQRLGESVAGGFREGMKKALKIYADDAQRMLEVGESMIRSFHDEGSRSLSDVLKGNLSGGDALRQFGQGILGNAIDQSSSRIFDSLTTSIFGAGEDIQSAGQGAAGDVRGAGGLLTGALTGISTGLSSLLQSIFGGVSSSFIGPVAQAQGGVWNGVLLPTRAAGGGVFGRRTLLEVAEVAGRQEAVVPMSRGGITADMTSRGPRVRVAGADIPLSFRGGGMGGGNMTTIHVSPEIHIHAHSPDPGAASALVMSQMPQIEKAITSALVRGSNRALRDAVQGAAR